MPLDAPIRRNGGNTTSTSRNNHGRGVTTAFAVLIFLALGPGQARACSCARMTRAEVVARSSLAFRGFVERVGMSRSGREEIAVVRVGQIYKGAAPRRLRTVGARLPGMCGYPLRAGRDYDFAGSLDPRSWLPIDMCGMVPLNSDR